MHDFPGMQEESDRLHEGLRRSFAELLGRVDDARFEDRAGYRLVVCPRVPFPGLNGIWLEEPDGSASVHDIAGAINEVEQLSAACWVELRAGRTPTAEHQVRGLGFTHQESIPGTVLRPTELVVIPGSELAVKPVRDAAGLAVAATLAAEGFEVPREDLAAALFTPAVAAMPGLSIYVARAGGRPVSTATVWIGDGGVGIFNVATPPEQRGRGYGGAVTTKAIADGFSTGADLAWLQASPLGESVYRAMGFRQVDTYR